VREKNDSASCGCQAAIEGHGVVVDIEKKSAVEEAPSKRTDYRRCLNVSVEE
jgi:hypothetical protein